MIEVICEYIASRAQWKIVSAKQDTEVQGGNEFVRLPKQRYFDTQKEVCLAMQEVNQCQDIDVRLRDFCEEENHGLQLAKKLCVSNDGRKVYLQCSCGRKRVVGRHQYEGETHVSQDR